MLNEWNWRIMEFLYPKLRLVYSIHICVNKRQLLLRGCVILQHKKYFNLYLPQIPLYYTFKRLRDFIAYILAGQCQSVTAPVPGFTARGATDTHFFVHFDTFAATTTTTLNSKSGLLCQSIVELAASPPIPKTKKQTNHINKQTNKQTNKQINIFQILYISAKSSQIFMKISGKLPVGFSQKLKQKQNKSINKKTN